MVCSFGDMPLCYKRLAARTVIVIPVCIAQDQAVPVQELEAPTALALRLDAVREKRMQECG
jgi:hypothetical protein